MLYGERPKRSAYYVTSEGVERLNRLPFSSGSYDERWLQDLIEEHPEILPTGEISVEFSPLVCIGREVEVGSDDTKGCIDNLYVTPSGNIVIVETKLWRNQESRRTVIAQVIDYAKELQKWDAERLNAVAEDYTFKKEGQAFRIIDLLARHGGVTFDDQTTLYDCLNENLKNASFLLLIVGDGIRSNVQQLAEFLNDNASVSFRLGLVELELYQQGSGICVVPFLQLKTTVIQRQIHTFFRQNTGPLPQSSERRKYVPKPVLSQREFTEIFCDRGGYQADMMTEFLGDLEMLDGVSINITPTELHVDIQPDRSRRVTALYFGISGDAEATVYIRPDRFKRGLADCGCSEEAIANFLQFFTEFVDVRKCKSPPYEFGMDRFYYAFPQKVMESAGSFAAALEKLVAETSE